MTRLVTRLGALLVVGLALTGCDTSGSALETPASPPSAVNPLGRPDAAAPGLEIRYLDEDGNPQVLKPKDFPRR